MPSAFLWPVLVPFAFGSGAGELGVMRHRPLILSLASAVVLLVAVVAGFVFWLMLDMRAVERVARDCQPLVEVLATVRGKVGRYPPASSVLLPMELTQLCHYQDRDDGYSLVLTGSDFNMQTYVYDSSAGRWYWD